MTEEKENLYRQEKIQKYTAIFKNLFRYIPWLKEKQGQSTSHIYENEELNRSSMPVRVYDSTLLSLKGTECHGTDGQELRLYFFKEYASYSAG